MLEALNLKIFSSISGNNFQNVLKFTMLLLGHCMHPGNKFKIHTKPRQTHTKKTPYIFHNFQFQPKLIDFIFQFSSLFVHQLLVSGIQKTKKPTNFELLLLLLLFLNSFNWCRTHARSLARNDLSNFVC